MEQFQRLKEKTRKAGRVSAPLINSFPRDSADSKNNN